MVISRCGFIGNFQHIILCQDEKMHMQGMHCVQKSLLFLVNYAHFCHPCCYRHGLCIRSLSRSSLDKIAIHFYIHVFMAVYCIVILSIYPVYFYPWIVVCTNHKVNL